jgi:hypothetical protein
LGRADRHGPLLALQPQLVARWNRYAFSSIQLDTCVRRSVYPLQEPVFDFHHCNSDIPFSANLNVMTINLIFILSAVLSCSAYSARFQTSRNQNGSHIDQPNPGVDPNLFSELRHRSSSLVDVQSIPSGNCWFGSDCTYPTADLIPTCPLVSVPCPADAPSYQTQCYSYKIDCFCNAPRPLWCAWDCGWADWMGVEDWCRFPSVSYNQKWPLGFSELYLIMAASAIPSSVLT